METKQVILGKAIRAEITTASALIEAEILMDHENTDFVRGFLHGYDHCLKLAESFDALQEEKE
jgi:hypothetical protein